MTSPPGRSGEAIGVPAVPASTTDVVYPPGHKWNEQATSLRLATSRIPENMGIEIIEPTAGPTPWTVWLEQQRGDSVQHIGFDIDTADNVEHFVQFLKSKGGNPHGWCSEGASAAVCG